MFGISPNDLAKAGELIKTSADTIKRTDENIGRIIELLIVTQNQQSSIIERLVSVEQRVKVLLNERYTLDHPIVHESEQEMKPHG